MTDKADKVAEKTNRTHKWSRRRSSNSKREGCPSSVAIHVGEDGQANVKPFPTKNDTS